MEMYALYVKSDCVHRGVIDCEYGRLAFNSPRMTHTAAPAQIFNAARCMREVTGGFLSASRGKSRLRFDAYYTCALPGLSIYQSISLV